MDRDACILSMLPDLQHSEPSALNRCWQDPRSHGGMRLSRWGQDRLQQSAAPHWRFEIDPAWVTPRNMLRMDRLIPVPYSLDHSARPRRSWITVWDSGQAMTIELLGDFDRFLVALERAWPRNS